MSLLCKWGIHRWSEWRNCNRIDGRINVLNYERGEVATRVISQCNICGLERHDWVRMSGKEMREARAASSVQVENE